MLRTAIEEYMKKTGMNIPKFVESMNAKLDVDSGEKIFANQIYRIMRGEQGKVNNKVLKKALAWELGLSDERIDELSSNQIHEKERLQPEAKGLVIGIHDEINSFLRDNNLEPKESSAIASMLLNLDVDKGLDVESKLADFWWKEDMVKECIDTFPESHIIGISSQNQEIVAELSFVPLSIEQCSNIDEFKEKEYDAKNPKKAFEEEAVGLFVLNFSVIGEYNTDEYQGKLLEHFLKILNRLAHSITPVYFNLPIYTRVFRECDCTTFKRLGFKEEQISKIEGVEYSPILMKLESIKNLKVKSDFLRQLCEIYENEGVWR